MKYKYIYLYILLEIIVLFFNIRVVIMIDKVREVLRLSPVQPMKESSLDRPATRTVAAVGLGAVEPA